LAPPYRDFVALIESLRDADPAKGIVMVSLRLQESFTSYADLYRRTRAYARQFRAKGVRPGDRVVIPLATNLETIASFLALVTIGAVPFSVTEPLLGQDREAHRRQIVRLIRAYGVHRLFVSEELSAIAGAYPDVPAEMALAAIPPSPAELADETLFSPASVGPDDVAFVQFSSGSTSQPKGVRITHRGWSSTPA